MNEKLILSVILLISISLNGLAQNKKTVQAKLSGATVFFKGAELTHTASYNLAKGENEIYIEGLSPNIDKNSLKVRATNGAVISAYGFSVDFLSESKSANPVIKKLQDSVDLYSKRLEEINTDIDVTANLIALLRKGTDKNVSGSEKGLGIDELVKTMDYYKTKATELQAIQSANNKKKSDCTQTISRLKRQLDQESLKNNKSVGVLKLDLVSPAPTNSTFTVSYYTTAAGWVPHYDINITSTDRPIKITAKSKVRQTTGIDWERANLTLSTATPGNGKTAPLFSTWFLDFVRPAVSLRGRSVSAMQNMYSYELSSEALADDADYVLSMESVASTGAKKEKPLIVVNGSIVSEDYLASLDPGMIKSVDVLKDASATSIYGSRAADGVIVVTLNDSMDDYVAQSENELNMIYTIDIPYTILGNGKEQTIDLQTREAQAEYKYYCAPKLDSETYLLAEIPNWEKLNLLNGKANITYDGTYVGESYINAHSTHEKLALTLGTDKRVSVKREKLNDYSSTRFLGNDVRQVFTYRLTVKNNQNKPVKMVLKDQYPISTQRSIEVELLAKDTTPWTVNRDDLGVITWEEDFKAGETKTYQISYSVKYPKGSNLNL